VFVVTLGWSLQIPAALGFPYLENDLRRFYTLGRIVFPRLITDTAPVTGIKNQESIQTLSPSVIFFGNGSGIFNRVRKNSFLFLRRSRPGRFPNLLKQGIKIRGNVSIMAEHKDMPNTHREPPPSTQYFLQVVSSNFWQKASLEYIFLEQKKIFTTQESEVIKQSKSSPSLSQKINLSFERTTTKR
jgi:hypothetical protein